MHPAGFREVHESVLFDTVPCRSLYQQSENDSGLGNPCSAQSFWKADGLARLNQLAGSEYLQKFDGFPHFLVVLESQGQNREF